MTSLTAYNHCETVYNVNLTYDKYREKDSSKGVTQEMFYWKHYQVFYVIKGI